MAGRIARKPELLFLLSLGLHSFFHCFRRLALHGEHGFMGERGAGALTGIAAIQAIRADAGIVAFGMNHEAVAMGTTTAHEKHLFSVYGMIIARKKKTVNNAAGAGD